MKAEIEKITLDTKVVAIVRGFAPDICLKLADAYRRGGIRLVEVTFNQKAPETWKDTAAAIKAIREEFAGEVRVGAGTVLTEEQLSICENAGGEYIVTPNVNVSLIKTAVGRGLVAMPGALTPSEAVDAWTAGASFVKLFPAGSLGPGYVKAVRAPLSHIPFLAVGGISAANAAEYIKAGCVGVGVGGNLTNKEWIDAGAWDKIEDAARQLILSVTNP
ncbi:MAG: bifunctional 4-hydroxy-2-oxoglutarate aldolase/2-dehydro-3-deoxy-phosphogluconate aldolase [Kiritimatiellae bacterium]|nr:bifunctional 4-hydroxy-2-oxoglutarate aldolase/2-dehydro-3-deoxy-phosphogluconate aldolase [Kiritimatiellia bacterium]